MGQGFHNLGRFGQALETGVRGATTGMAKGVQYGGAGLQAAGGGLRRAAAMTKPLEPYAATRAGIGYGDRSPLSEEQITFDRWRKKRERDNMGLDLAKR